ncbi:MAG TPA: site-2 protease family protein [Terriglobia bacterium]
MDDGPSHSSVESSILTGPTVVAPHRRAWWDFLHTRLERPLWRFRERFRAPAWTSSLRFHLLLFALTGLSTVTVGAGIALNYSRRLPPFNFDFLSVFLWQHPDRIALGLPFSGALLGILLAHELGHYLACRYYGLRASYPYFIPAPTLIGTLGAFIRIRSPIINRRVLFDVAVAGPIAGFVLAVPLLAFAILHSRVGSVPMVPDSITFGRPLALTLLIDLLRPGVSPAVLSLTPVGCAAWVGLFATALNLLPMSQLDGGHILYALFGRKHRTFSRAFWLALLPLGYFSWPGWFLWAAIIALIGVGHPPVLLPSDAFGRRRKALAVVAAAMFVLCFMPTPFIVH